MKYVSLAAFMALAIASAPSFAGNGCGGGGHGGNGSGNPKNDSSFGATATQKPWFVWQDGKLVRNPERV